MKIDITGANGQDLFGLLQKFPSGIIKVENSKAFWEFNNEVQTIQYPPIMPPQNQENAILPPSNQARGANPPQTAKKNTFLNMFDTMASYF